MGGGAPVPQHLAERESELAAGGRAVAGTRAGLPATAAGGREPGWFAPFGKALVAAGYCPVTGFSLVLGFD